MIRRLSCLGDRLRGGGSFARYLVVGVGTSLLDLSLFTLLSVALVVPEVPANVCSTVITLMVSYFINRSFVFRSADPPSLRGFFSFAGVTLVSGILVQSAIIWGLIRAATIALPAVGPGAVNPGAKVIAMGCGAMCNYLGYRLVFASRQGSRSA